ncbi:MAG: hypothetical protein ACT4TC_12025 [Myxococcaceae bacterium]
MKRTSLLMIAFAAALLVVGCGKRNNNGGEKTDGGITCFENPTTHVEIINACTTAEAFDKIPTLPLLLPTGELPPLP